MDIRWLVDTSLIHFWDSKFGALQVRKVPIFRWTGMKYGLWEGLLRIQIYCFYLRLLTHAVGGSHQSERSLVRYISILNFGHGIFGGGGGATSLILVITPQTNVHHSKKISPPPPQLYSFEHVMWFPLACKKLLEHFKEKRSVQIKLYFAYILHVG